MKTVVLTLCVASSLFLQAAAEGPVPTFQQTLVVEGPNTAPPQILPVYAGKEWAFSARWDDNNSNSLNMRQAMADLGLKGSFYLNAVNPDNKADVDLVRKLCMDGCSVAGHTLDHYWLPTLNPNALFRQILENRIQLEAVADRPVNSFAFPYGRYSSQYSDTMQWITRAWLRSGYHHSVYSGFVRKNPDMPKSYASTVNQVVPGDRKIDGRRFRETMEKILSDPERFRLVDYSISLGVHAWQPPEELEKFKTLLTEYAGRDEFWYCNQTDFASYRFQAKQTTISPATSSPGTYIVTRPDAAAAGSDIPLTLAVPKTASRVFLDGRELNMMPYDETFCLVELPFPAGRTAPDKIARVDCGHPGSNEFPGLKFRLSVLPDGGWTLALSNESPAALSDLCIILRLPLCYEDGIRLDHPADLPAGKTAVRTYAAGTMQTEPVYSEGSMFAAAEIDFMQSGRRGRIHVVYEETESDSMVNDVRDAADLAGPLAPDSIDWTQLLKLSTPGSERTALSETPSGQWYRSIRKMRQLFLRDHIVPFSDDPAWINDAKAFDKKPALLVAVFDVQVPKSGLLDVQSDCRRVQAGLDGHDIRPGDQVSSGPHRLLLVLNTEGKLRFYREFPVRVRVMVAGMPVSFVLK